MRAMAGSHECTHSVAPIPPHMASTNWRRGWKKRMPWFVWPRPEYVDGLDGPRHRIGSQRQKKHLDKSGLAASWWPIQQYPARRLQSKTLKRVAVDERPLDCLSQLLNS